MTDEQWPNPVYLVYVCFFVGGWYYPLRLELLQTPQGSVEPTSISCPCHSQVLLPLFIWRINRQRTVGYISCDQYSNKWWMAHLPAKASSFGFDYPPTSHHSYRLKLHLSNRKWVYTCMMDLPASCVILLEYQRIKVPTTGMLGSALSKFQCKLM